MNKSRAVLIVDDDEDIRSAIIEVLRDEGYVTRAASNGREALECLTNSISLPDVILLDLMMPEMDGRAFRGEQLKSPKLASIPIIVFTAHCGVHETAEELRAAGCLRKPVRLEEIVLELDRVLSLHPAA